jgi:hypothetical protein
MSSSGLAVSARSAIQLHASASSSLPRVRATYPSADDDPPSPPVKK